MDNFKKAFSNLSRTISDWQQREPVPFVDFVQLAVARPEVVIRNIFQLFHDMIKSHVVEGAEEYPDDMESIHYLFYDCTALFVKDSDNPFFADRLFANRLVNLVESFKRGAQQNKIYIFEGPPGSGKSTFLNNLLNRVEQYANTEEGALYETVWRISPKALGVVNEKEANQLIEELSQLSDSCPQLKGHIIKAKSSLNLAEECIEVPCPSHDHPILQIPKQLRRDFFDDLYKNDERKWKLFTAKEFEWLFRSNPCTICSSLYQALLNKLNHPSDVYKMLYARPYHFNRRVGEGISVYAPGDKPMKQSVLTNEMLQNRLNELFKDSNQVRYVFSRFAKTNNGIYALMDVKSNNLDRLVELHSIISEGVHKVDDLEENVNSLFIALMNPEDKQNIRSLQSFADRIESIKIPYVLDLNTEVEIYRNVFGKHIDEHFLPRALHNFARVIISTRLKLQSDALIEWINIPAKYHLYCDENLQLLKMEIYTGYIPKWLSESDRKKLTAKLRRKIIGESEFEGWQGFSGRDSIKVFNDFFSTYARKDKLINMSDLINYFTKLHADLGESIPKNFLDSLLRMYNYTVLQEVKESLYYYNEQQISKDIQNYLFAINFEPGTKVTCTYTGERLEITEDYISSIEIRLLSEQPDKEQRRAFRRETQKEYTSRTLTQEIMVEGKPLTMTKLFQALHEQYVHNLKDKALDPFLANENFRRAIKDFGTDPFKTYDKKIRADVAFLINNLCTKHRYTRQGAKEVCIYVIDNNLAQEFRIPY